MELVSPHPVAERAAMFGRTDFDMVLIPLTDGEAMTL